MTQDDFIDALMEAFESEPELEYGDRITSRNIRRRGIEERFRTLCDQYDEEREDDE